MPKGLDLRGNSMMWGWRDLKGGVTDELKLCVLAKTRPPVTEADCISMFLSSLAARSLIHFPSSTPLSVFIHSGALQERVRGAFLRLLVLICLSVRVPLFFFLVLIWDT